MKLTLLSLLLFAASSLHAQQKGTPDHFDFYLLNVVPAAEFCNIADVGQPCEPPHKGWVLHGLWPQNVNGSYPVFCDEGVPGPVQPRANFDLTPDLPLLDHEWLKHGTCTRLAPDDFFAVARRAYHRFTVPSVFARPNQPVVMKSADVLKTLARANPSAPPKSLIFWCKEGKLTSVSQCLAKDGKPIACQGLKSCADDSVTIPARVHY